MTVDTSALNISRTPSRHDNFLTLFLKPFFKTNKVTIVFHFIVDRKTIAILKGDVYREFDWSARQHESTSLLGLLAKIKV